MAKKPARKPVTKLLGPVQLDKPIHADELAKHGLAYQRVVHLPGSTYKDLSTIIVVPMRDPMVHHRIAQSWMNLIGPMNQKRGFIFATGDEVGVAYTQTIQNILADKELSTWKYVMTLEADNLQPPDAQIRLLETIEVGKYDAVSGIYFTKGPVNMPMAYGDPEVYARTGVLDFKPRDIREALGKGQIMEVNGIAMGCSIYRMDLFRQIPPPWFVTVADIVEGKGVQGFTQDLWFCKRAKEMGKRFAVDLRVRVGHMDLGDGTIY